jgi:hypothetical protein
VSDESKSHSVSKNYPLSFSKDKLEKRYLDPKASGGAMFAFGQFLKIARAYR